MTRLTWPLIKFGHMTAAFLEFHSESVNRIKLLTLLSIIAYLALYPFNYYMLRNTQPSPPQAPQSQLGGTLNSNAPEPAVLSADDPEDMYMYYQEHFLEWPVNLLTIFLVFAIVSLLHRGGPAILKLLLDLWKR